jgi:hypothetical protein
LKDEIKKSKKIIKMKKIAIKIRIKFDRKKIKEDEIIRKKINLKNYLK